MPTNVVEVNEKDLSVLKANECIAATKRARPAARLFDEFWREGELAMLFGASGAGKSILAVQIADALARGTAMWGFVMPKGRRKVLYVDLGLSDAQFQARYRNQDPTRNADAPVRNEPAGRTRRDRSQSFSNAS